MSEKRHKGTPLKDLERTAELIQTCFSLIAESTHKGMHSEAVSKGLRFLDKLFQETQSSIEKHPDFKKAPASSADKEAK